MRLGSMLIYAGLLTDAQTLAAEKFLTRKRPL
jgi:hypothetical protein